MEATLIDSQGQFISPVDEFFFIFVVFQGEHILELLKFEAIGFAKFLLFILLPEKFEDKIESKLDFLSLLFAGFLNQKRNTFALMMMQFS
jgi:hypothetical protein